VREKSKRKKSKPTKLNGDMDSEISDYSSQEKPRKLSAMKKKKKREFVDPPNNCVAAIGPNKNYTDAA
jgi:hypothetical protein